MSGLEDPGGMRMKGMENLFCYEWGITYDAERLSEAGSIGVEIIRMAVDSPLPYGPVGREGEGVGVLGG